MITKTKIKKGDTVKVMQGKDRGKTAKVASVFPEEGRLIVEGLNLKKRHLRPRKAGQKGEIIQIPAPMHISNVEIVCSSCGKATRVGYRLVENGKVRICRKCKADL